MSALHEQPLIQHTPDSERLSTEETEQYLASLNKWQLCEENNIPLISREFSFKNFLQAQAFANAVGELAERENHHPRICIEWGKVVVSWWTHSLKGLFINDFIMADRCNQLYLESAND